MSVQTRSAVLLVDSYIYVKNVYKGAQIKYILHYVCGQVKLDLPT